VRELLLSLTVYIGAAVTRGVLMARQAPDWPSSAFSLAVSSASITCSCRPRLNPDWVLLCAHLGVLVSPKLGIVDSWLLDDWRCLCRGHGCSAGVSLWHGGALQATKIGIAARHTHCPCCWCHAAMSWAHLWVVGTNPLQLWLHVSACCAGGTCCLLSSLQSLPHIVYTMLCQQGCLCEQVDKA
jgi:hypothetical protein